MTPTIIFSLSAAIVVLSGIWLARFGGQIAELSGLGRLWIGVVLVTGATSLPPFFSELPKWFFNSLPGSRGRTRCCSDLFEQQTPRMRCFAPVWLADCG
jgi:hypothetical protein